MSTKIKPLSDRLVVKAQLAESKTKGGIVLPDTADKDKPMTGNVVAVGPGRFGESGKLQPLQVEVGDQIVFGKYAGTAFKLNDEEYLIMREEDVMGVLV